ncbi:MAG TPA: hypothetical protein PLK04_08910, partial [Bacillota bacterium]|nr:hypothetical protein [Bacillota bacterium]
LCRSAVIGSHLCIDNVHILALAINARSTQPHRDMISQGRWRDRNPGSTLTGNHLLYNDQRVSNF